MTLRNARLGLLALSVVTLGAGTAGSRQPNPAEIPPGPAWAEVLSVTPKWLVLRNAQGQQIPVSLGRDGVDMFVVRWPTTPDRLRLGSILEVTGLDVGTNTVQTDHVDVFEADARGLLAGPWPFVASYNGDQPIAPYTADQRVATLGYDLLNANLDASRQPARLHAVAEFAGVDPLRMFVGGNNTLSVAPSPNGLTLTQVTGGSATYVKPGDLAYYVPAAATPRALALSQLIIYKAMPLDRFTP